MKREVKKLIKDFYKDVSKILDDSVVDVIIHGSTVTGDFIPGKGDIDFLVFNNKKITTTQRKEIFKYHRLLRKGTTLARQLEGCYYTISSDRNEVIGGIYLGTGEAGWREVDHIVNSKLEMANILSSYYSTHESGILEDLFQYNWPEVITELKVQSRQNINYLSTYNDSSFQEGEYSFHIYAVYTAARSLYTAENHGFIPKSESLKWLAKKPEFEIFKDLLIECSKFRNPLNTEDIERIKIERFYVLREFLYKIDNYLNKY